MKTHLRRRRTSISNAFFPPTGPWKRVLQALVITSAAGWLYGCGVQGTPHPPRVERPQKITNLSAVQMGQSLEIRFTLPQQTTDGERLTKPLEFEILRAVAPEQNGLAKLPEPDVWMHLLANEWLPYAQGNEVAYSAHLSEREFHDWQAHTLVVGVRTLTRGFRHRALNSDPSNLVDVPIIDVSGPVEGIKSVTTEKAVDLQFSPPAATLSGAPIHGLTGYRIYRSPMGRAGTFELIGETATSLFADTKFEFGQTYYYQIRAVFGAPGHVALSDPSPAVKTTPRDVFPPAPPQGLSGTYSAGAVELVWTENSEADLAGYNVYRIENGAAQRLNQKLVLTPVFRDVTVTPGKTFTYEVTAVDLSGNESKPSTQEEVETK